MEFLSSVDTYDADGAARSFWERLESELVDVDGYAFYQHPLFATVGNAAPDFTVIGRGIRPFIVRIFRFGDAATSIDVEGQWFAEGKQIDSPLLELEDFVVALTNRIETDRRLRGQLNVLGVLFAPHIESVELTAKIQRLLEELNREVILITSVPHVPDALKGDVVLQDDGWSRLKSIAQGMHTFNRNREIAAPGAISTRAAAVKVLENEIKLLDEEQLKVGIQIAPGPQRIRGLAGTGKTVVLAMKAANIHVRYPTARILFTFHTQSLYNQARALISRFYREQRDTDPNWEMLQVRHGWGGRDRPGVYYEACRRADVKPLNFNEAVSIDPVEPLNACCEQLNNHGVEPYYDYILMDEAQDFPSEFYRLIGKLAVVPDHGARRIYFAYDELQSLSNLEVPNPEDQFGTDGNGNPIVSLAGEDYAGGIEKDFVLHRSYRCPLEVLVLAHAIGLGIHRPEGPVQMLTNRASWVSVGYEVVEGDFVAGQDIVIRRTPSNSPNRIREILPDGPPLVSVRSFANRSDELDWVASSLRKLVQEEAIPPDKIVIICLESRIAKKTFANLEARLRGYGILSTTLGFTDVTWEFAEAGRVTLSTVFRAKGNEAPFVYIIAGEALYSYANPIENRNRAFTSVSRSKAWLTITGFGRSMEKAAEEVDAVLRDVPFMRFPFPDVSALQIRSLDASETSRRKRAVSTARKSVEQLLLIEEGAFDDLDPVALREVVRKLASRVQP